MGTLCDTGFMVAVPCRLGFRENRCWYGDCCGYGMAYFSWISFLGFSLTRHFLPRVKLNGVVWLLSVAGFLSLAVGGCATQTHLRPADTLKAGEVELTGAMSANTSGWISPVAQGAVGVTDWLELGGQAEFLSTLGWARFGLLHTEKHGLGLALTVGGGYRPRLGEVFFAELYDEDYSGLALLSGVTVGFKKGKLEPYAALNALYLPSSVGNFIIPSKLGLRVHTGPVIWSVEGGATSHWIGGTELGLVVGEFSGAATLHLDVLSKKRGRDPSY